uniref:DNA helicase Pif1-like protein n=1 Tax=Tanacetum cinerariifolium TaxID=118510 RepID=A0A699H9R2_TANCI|nr:DNA helicase Pif1-like protein [Tanacetum cinerariifolium]
MDLNYVRSLFHFVEFECLLEIKEQVCPRFILEFHSQYQLSYSDEGQMFVEFVIQNKYFSFPLEDFAQLFRIPCEGACVFSDRWSLDELVYGAHSEGPYQTNLPSPDDIISFIREDREGQVTRICHQEEVESENLERIVAREEVIIPLPLPPSMNHLHLISTMMMMEIMKGPRVQSSSSFLSSSSSSSHHSTMNSTNASSSNPFKKIKLTIIPPRQLFVNISSDEDITTTPSPTTTSLSPTPLNALSKTTSTNQTSSSQENTSSSFNSKLQISPPSSHEPTSPHLNPLLDNISDVPPRPLNPQPLQIHPSLDITLSLSPITPLDHIYETPSPPQPQPPIMGNPLFYNYHDYHGSTCICCSHNQNLFFTLRDEINIMFAHLKYLLTATINSHFPPPP